MLQKNKYTYNTCRNIHTFLLFQTEMVEFEINVSDDGEVILIKSGNVTRTKLKNTKLHNSQCFKTFSVRHEF